MNEALNIDIPKPGKKASHLRQYELVDLVRAYDPSVNEALLNKAYVFSVKAHGQQKRHSGDPYYAHPIEVAGILAGLHLDVASICTALLHDVLEDTETTYEQLAREFSTEIADLVDGVTKLGQVEMSRPDASREQAQAENLQKFILAISKDVRVLLVKLCDRLHNMRTLHHHPKKASRERISKETLEIYAPLARRIGMDKVCSELEDLSFRYINPAAFVSINRRLQDWRATQDAAISEIFIELKSVLDGLSDRARLYGREKRAYAIWRKLQRQNISFDDVADIYAFRMIVEDVPSCYKLLGELHTKYRAVPERFRDFISVPKPNGYQSLHTTIRMRGNRRVEIQIRTERMEDIAQRGVAAHWTYKDQSYAYDPESAKRSGSDPLARIRPLVELLDISGDADEFLEHVKLEMFTDQVFTFTPKGDLIAMPRGATPIDFAYAVHTMIGDTCVGAIVNNRDVPLRTKLRNGDVVKIVRGGKAEPQEGWEAMAITGKARSALRRLTRDGQSEEFRKTGAALADHAFRREDKVLSEKALVDVVKRLNLDSSGALYEQLGRGALSMRNFMSAVFPARRENGQDSTVEIRDLIDDDTVQLYVKGEGLREGVSLHLSPCCSPMPGDRIVGLQAAGRGIDIHTIDCEELVAVEDKAQKLWIDLAWRRAASQTASLGRILSVVEHVPGALADITKIIEESSGNVTNIKTLKRSPAFFDMIFDIEVHDNRHLIQIIAALRASRFVVSAERTRELNESTPS